MAGTQINGTQSTVNSRVLNNASGTITTGGVAQQVLAANTSRQYILIENPVGNGNATLYFDFTGTATTSSMSLSPGGAYEQAEWVSTQALSVYCASTGQTFNVYWS
jgi:hypothetical protein